MKRHKTAIIGLGNHLLSDEGVGIQAIHLLRKMLKGEEVDLIECGTSGMSLLHQIDERKKIVFIDAGYCGLKPGNYIRFRPDEVKSRKKLRNFSLHEFDLIELLDFARSLKKTEKVNMVIYCIQPEEIMFGEKLSHAVKKSLPGLVQKVYEEVKKNLNDK